MKTLNDNNLTYGFKEGLPPSDGQDYLCYTLVKPHPSQYHGVPVYRDGIARGFWLTSCKASGYFMDDMGFIGWMDAVCLLHHGMPVDRTRGEDGKCLPHVWDQEFASILHRTGYSLSSTPVLSSEDVSRVIDAPIID